MDSGVVIGCPKMNIFCCIFDYNWYTFPIIYYYSFICYLYIIFLFAILVFIVNYLLCNATPFIIFSIKYLCICKCQVTFTCFCYIVLLLVLKTSFSSSISFFFYYYYFTSIYHKFVTKITKKNHCV